LLRAGDACLVTAATDIAELVGRIGDDLAPPEEPSERRETDGLDDRALRVHEALDRRDDMSPEQVAIRSGVPVEQVRAVLPALELTGHAEHHDTGWRRQEAGYHPSGDGGHVSAHR